MGKRNNFHDIKYTLAEVVEKYGYDYTLQGDRGHMNCPRCGREKKVTLEFSENYYRCVACSLSGYAISLFAYNEFGITNISLCSVSEKKKVAREFHKFMGSDSFVEHHPSPAPEKTKPIPVASDDTSDHVYSALAKIPELALTSFHTKLLMDRGLSKDRIKSNGYCTIPNSFKTEEVYEKMYQSAGGDTKLNEVCKVVFLKKQQVKFGLKIADILVSQHLDLNGVPGFFKFGSRWCFWAISGILIPVRNMKGQIVLWQVRKDKTYRKKDGKMSNRYVTISNIKLPGHTTSSVCRVHHPLNNAEINSINPIYLTEGPLKADIACYLYNSPSVWMAIQGINNTKDLFNNVLPHLKELGITKYYNALDMDRLTNPNVGDNSKEISIKSKEIGVSCIEKYWGIEYATTIVVSLSLLAQTNHIPVDLSSTTNVFQKIACLSSALQEAHIPYCKHIDEKGNTITTYWDPKTKGIDDYLFSLQK